MILYQSHMRLTSTSLGSSQLALRLWIRSRNSNLPAFRGTPVPLICCCAVEGSHSKCQFYYTWYSHQSKFIRFPALRSHHNYSPIWCLICFLVTQLTPPPQPPMFNQPPPPALMMEQTPTAPLPELPLLLPERPGLPQTGNAKCRMVVLDGSNIAYA